MAKLDDHFRNPLKQKLIDFRTNNLTLYEIIDYIYELEPRIEKKLLSLQKKNTKDWNARRKKSESEKRRRRILRGL